MKFFGKKITIFCMLGILMMAQQAYSGPFDDFRLAVREALDMEKALPKAMETLVDKLGANGVIEQITKTVATWQVTNPGKTYLTEPKAAKRPFLGVKPISGDPVKYKFNKDEIDAIGKFERFGSTKRFVLAKDKDPAQLNAQQAALNTTLTQLAWQEAQYGEDEGDGTVSYVADPWFDEDRLVESAKDMVKFLGKFADKIDPNAPNAGADKSMQEFVQQLQKLAMTLSEIAGDFTGKFAGNWARKTAEEGKDGWTDATATATSALGAGLFAGRSLGRFWLPLALVVGGVVAVPTVGFFAIKMIYHKLQEQLKNPGFIAETNALSWWQSLFINAPLAGSMKEFIALASFKTSLLNYARKMAILKKTGGKIGLMALFYGSYGLGKTFVARKIAHASGHRFAVVSCSAVREHKHFAKMLLDKLKWARENHVVLIFDEAEKLFGKVHDNDLDGMVLNELIGLLGTPEKRPHVILITNHPKLLNDAFTGPGGRIGEWFEFPVPDRETVERLLRQKISFYRKILRVPLVYDLDFAEAATKVGIRAGREIQDIVGDAFLQAKIAQQPLDLDFLERAARKRDGGRQTFGEFKLPSEASKPAEAQRSAVTAGG